MGQDGKAGFDELTYEYWEAFVIGLAVASRIIAEEYDKKDFESLAVRLIALRELVEMARVDAVQKALRRQASQN